MLASGATYGEFTVLEQIDTGGFAAVYRVRTPRLAEPAALKLSLMPVVQSETAKRALREIGILRALRSPHAVRIHDGGMRSDGHVFLLLEYVDGQQLGRWHDFDEPLDVETALTMIRQACIGLCEAHAEGIVHRDLKPQNLFVQNDGQLKVLDFGLARAWSGEGVAALNATTSHMFIGTPHYGQPEQAATSRLHPAADVYTLATIAYELLSGHSMFVPDEPLSVVVERSRTDPGKWIRHHVRSPVVPITRYRSDLPIRLVSVLERALDKDPTNRPAHATELSVELTQILDTMRGEPGHEAAVVYPSGRIAFHRFGPGTFRVGAGKQCEIRLPGKGPEIDAVIDWWGEGEPELSAGGDRLVMVQGVPVVGRIPLEWDQRIKIGEWEVRLTPGAGRSG